MQRSPGTGSILVAVLACILTAGAAAAQELPGWNTARVLDLVDRARRLRRTTVVDSAFRAYQAEARGYVYFFIDRPDSDERTLVKADQIALEVFWQAPNRTKQRIVGLRDRKVLPTNIRYHLDHLTVVQDDFGDRIRLGDGDEVAAVTHPVAPRATGVYDYRLADSLSIRYGGGQEEVRVYEVRVKPKDPAGPGFIGSVYLARATAAIVRMSFTFTPSSYVDPHLDYIRISLDNSLWEGRYWLPYRQEAELRREIPQLDFLAGSIIRGRFEIGSYEFNPDLPPAVFLGQGVSALPQAQRESFPFERELFDDLEEEGLAPTPSIEEIRAQARQVLAGQVLSGLRPLRLHFPSVSDVLRYNRAEGLFVGSGVHLRPGAEVLLRLDGGYAVGRRKPSLLLSAQGEPAPIVPVAEAYWDELRAMGPLPASAPVISTFGTVLADEDWLDPYFVRGARVTLRGTRPGKGPALTLRWEKHLSATNVLDGGHRPVRPVDEGILGAIDLAVPVGLPGDGLGNVEATLGRLGERNLRSLWARGRWEATDPSTPWRMSGEVAGGVSNEGAPTQSLFLLGGRGTLPGYDFHAFAGRVFWLASGAITHPVFHPWFGMRAFAAVGASYLSDPSTFSSAWSVTDTDGLRASVGLGLSLGWDVLRLDLARGLRDGRWELIFSVDPRFHPWL
jgi:hypothetical protein